MNTMISIISVEFYKIVQNSVRRYILSLAKMPFYSIHYLDDYPNCSVEHNEVSYLQQHFMSKRSF